MPETTSTMEVHHPATVGSTFMRQYYHFLAKEPASLHRFYKDESVWSHGVGSQMQEPITGQRAINEAILRRGYAGARVDLDLGSIDCQASLHGGVFVLVTGVMTLTSSPVPKPFVQTFFLAVQPKGYFVLNDCLRFLELPATTTTTTATATSTPLSAATDVAVGPKDAKKPTTQSAIGTPVLTAAASPAHKHQPKPLTPAVKEKTPGSPAKAAPKDPAPEPLSPIKIQSPAKKTDSPAPTASPAKKPVTPAASPAPAAEDKKKKAAKPSETKPATPVKASPVEAAAPSSASAPAAAATAAAAPTTASPVKAPAAPVQPPAKPAEPAAPKTWAALFTPSQATAAPSAPAPTSAPAAAPKSTPVASTAAPAAATAPAAKSEKPQSSPKAKSSDAAAAPTSQHKERPRYFSLYIRDVPPQTKDTDLRELFKSYGSIANVTVPSGRGYAFVDFYEQESMRAALAEEKEFKVFDKVLQVDERTERKDKDRSGFRTDMRGRGRGGPKGRTGGERKEREDGKERRPAAERDANGRPNTFNGPRSTTDRREKGGRRTGKEDGAGRGGSRPE